MASGADAEAEAEVDAELPMPSVSSSAIARRGERKMYLERVLIRGFVLFAIIGKERDSFDGVC